MNETPDYQSGKPIDTYAAEKIKEWVKTPRIGVEVEGLLMQLADIEGYDVKGILKEIKYCGQPWVKRFEKEILDGKLALRARGGVEGKPFGEVHLRRIDQLQKEEDYKELITYVNSLRDDGFEGVSLISSILKDHPELMDYYKQDIAESKIRLEERRLAADAIDELGPWAGVDPGQGGNVDATLQPLITSHTHHLIQASNEGKLLAVDFAIDSDPQERRTKVRTIKLPESAVANPKVFIVQHDWAKVLGPAIQEVMDMGLPERLVVPDDVIKETFTVDQQSQEFMMPYDECFFEFKMSGRYVIVMTKQVPGQLPRVRTFIEFRNCWMSIGDELFIGLREYLWSQIAAVVVSLEAGVTQTQMTEPATALNKKRIKNHKFPIQPYHIVDLARRFKRDHQPSTEYQGKVRLHLRRGHRRHYSTHNVWIKWMLVGNPDLGFVDKHYKL